MAAWTSRASAPSHAMHRDMGRSTICRSWIGAMSGPGSTVSMEKASPVSPSGARQVPAMPNRGSPFMVKRWRVLRWPFFQPSGVVNSKKAVAGMTQRRPNARPSERMLNTGLPAGPGQPNRIWPRWAPSSLRRITGPSSPIRTEGRGSKELGRARGNSGILTCEKESSKSSHFSLISYSLHTPPN